MSATAVKPGGVEASALVDTLRTQLRDADPSALCVAFSGGPDSTALLHALAQLPAARQRGLRALHVDHGVQTDSAKWARRCADFCGQLDLPLTTVRVAVDDRRGEGLEAAARRARYAAFGGHLRGAEWLALAHHRDDQVETVLLKLLRGAGPEGLGGMRALRRFGHGFLWRPLLDIPRAALRSYLGEQALEPIDDPANADPRFARNVLRREILPVLVRHWPHADASILHAARLCREAADHLAREAESTLMVRDDGSLDAVGWLQLPDAIRARVLDAWLHARGFSAPPDASRAELWRQARTAAADRVPLVAWADVEVRVWNGALHATPPLAAPPGHWQAEWKGAPLLLPKGCGVLRLEGREDAAGTRFDPPLTVRFRRGGERIKPAGDPHTRELRGLFQQTRVPPWWRARCPLVYASDELVAVADLWCSEHGHDLFASHGTAPRWERPVQITGATRAPAAAHRDHR